MLELVSLAVVCDSGFSMLQLQRATATNAATGRDEPADYRISER